MDAETLQRLMIDASLGALDADARALLRAYLEREPAAAARAAALEATAELARRVMTDGRAADGQVTDAVVVLPPFPASALRRAQRNRGLIRFARRATAMAACLLLGLGIGAFRWGAAGGTGTSPMLATNGGPTVRPPAFHTDGFWSTQKWYDRAARAEPRAAGGLSWHSPVERPTLGGSL